MDRSIPSSDVDGEMIHAEVVSSLDRISKLPEDVLLKILSKLPMEEVLRTSVLSKKWVDVWKGTSHLYLDMRNIAQANVLLPEVSHQAAGSVTKIIKDHRGHLERCTIYHDSLQCEDGVFESWIQSLVNVKHIKHLKLVNLFDHLDSVTRSNVTLDLPPKSFSHPDLISLFLDEYNFEAPHAFYSCWSLKDLRLINISAETEVFNAVLVSCPSLEVLALRISCPKNSGTLKIENNNLKFLFLSCLGIEGLNVSSPNLDILSIEYLSCTEENCVTASARLHFDRNYWTAGHCFAHTSYDISCPHQSNNAARKESESSIEITRSTLLEEAKPFPNAQFRVHNVRLSNFSGSKEEFALASSMITHGTEYSYEPWFAGLVLPRLWNLEACPRS
ncbi:F-box/LRR protein [Hirschfeldia incana]|nr:F-box/LRR protein [Hirschfeldia incana]